MTAVIRCCWGHWRLVCWAAWAGGAAACTALVHAPHRLLPPLLPALPAKITYVFTPPCSAQYICLAFYQKEMALYARKNLDRRARAF